jgi:hypothetical protein
MSPSYGGYHLDCRTDAATENPDFRTLPKPTSSGALVPVGPWTYAAAPDGSTRGGMLSREPKGGQPLWSPTCNRRVAGSPNYFRKARSGCCRSPAISLSPSHPRTGHRQRVGCDRSLTCWVRHRNCHRLVRLLTAFAISFITRHRSLSTRQPPAPRPCCWVSVTYADSKACCSHLDRDRWNVR